MINNDFNVIGKKNNQISLSNADHEIPTNGSTDNARNLVNLGLGFLDLHWLPMIDSFCLTWHTMKIQH